MSRFETETYQADQEGSRPTYRIDHNEVDGQETLAVIFPPVLDKDQRVDVSSFLYLERAFALAFAHAFAVANLSNEPLSRRGNGSNISDGFLNWVARNFGKGAIGFPQFELSLFDQWDQWLVEKDHQGKYRLGTSTLMHYRSAISGVISALKVGDWRDQIHENCRLRKAPFAQKENQSKNVQPYDIHTFCRILVAIKQETKQSLKRLAVRTRLLEHGRALLARQDSGSSGRTDMSEAISKGLLMAKLQRAFGPVMPRLDVVKAHHEDLYDELQDWGASDIYGALHPSHQDLLPFAYQLCILTAFNPSTLLSLNIVDGIKTVRVLGAERVVFTAYKGRKKQYVTCSFLETDTDLSAPFIVKAVRTWTADIRTVASPDMADDFWLYVPRYNSSVREVRTMKLPKELGYNMDINNAVTKFQKVHALPRVSFARLRATVAALAHDLFGGDVRAVMDFLQHSSPEVTLKNYTNGVGKARHSEIIATVQQLRERWILSDGTIDPRVMAETGDPSATTPGWQCADPYNSPIPGQKPGRLCDAYGSCPSCPMARVNIRSAVSYARISQVRRELEEAKHRVLPERWALGLAPMHRAITEFWIPAFSESIVAEASQVYVKPIIPFD
ncbi:hypothetical protein KK141_17265 [Dyella sp. LX-66]|uniref:hypothetical protein n=1 Tax=unclassified Dyella TaxID=2634549 RepID=UPI001BE01E9C|nr:MULTISPECIES: hypothetical protein [unclassified Dyella]MBT2117784.1 hypothetical protein [Dyella sp. LX-1]MBT2141299.1 hypothetical protein [Dyella sp. LX-66]